MLNHVSISHVFDYSIPLIVTKVFNSQQKAVILGEDSQSAYNLMPPVLPGFIAIHISKLCAICSSSDRNCFLMFLHCTSCQSEHFLNSFFSSSQLDQMLMQSSGTTTDYFLLFILSCIHCRFDPSGRISSYVGCVSFCECASARTIAR